MLYLAQPLPAEEHHADQRCLEEEGHQALNSQRRTENIADIMGVIGPVHSELEFHGNPGRDTDREVDAEQQTPEFGHVAPDRTIGHHIDRLHHGDDDRQAEGNRHKQEVIHGRQRELQP